MYQQVLLFLELNDRRNYIYLKEIQLEKNPMTNHFEW